MTDTVHVNLHPLSLTHQVRDHNILELHPDDKIVISRWSGQQTVALREALRDTVVQFSERLGVGIRTISNWEARGADIEPLPEMQTLLDITLDQATDSQRARFIYLCQRRQSAFSTLILPGPSARSTQPGQPGEQAPLILIRRPQTEPAPAQHPTLHVVSEAHPRADKSA